MMWCVCRWVNAPTVDILEMDISPRVNQINLMTGNFLTMFDVPYTIQVFAENGIGEGPLRMTSWRLRWSYETKRGEDGKRTSTYVCRGYGVDSISMVKRSCNLSSTILLMMEVTMQNTTNSLDWITCKTTKPDMKRRAKCPSRLFRPTVFHSTIVMFGILSSLQMGSIEVKWFWSLRPS